MKYNKSNRFLFNNIVLTIIYLSFVFISCEYNKMIMFYQSVKRKSRIL